MQPRRPLPALALVMPHPDLPSRNDPRTPRPNTPSTPILFSKQLMASPRTSMESWGSSSGHPEEEVQWEWKLEQISLLTRTLEALPGHLYTPFNGAVPPSNLLDKIAKSVAYAQGPLEWPHSVRQTRAKLVEIARGRNKENMSMTIDEADEEEPPKRPLYRQSSMDFLPTVKEKNNPALTRLSTRLQRIDRLIPIYHPYPRPASRSPSPPADHLKDTYPFPPIATRIRPRLLSQPPPHPPLRRSVSTLSNSLSDVSMASSAAATSKPIRMKRADSFTAAPPGMKRAPSYGSVSVASSAGRMDVDGEGEDACDAMSGKGKRPRRSSAASSRGGSISPDRKKKKSTVEEEKKLVATKSKVKVKAKGKAITTTTTSTTATRTRTRSSSSAMKPTLSSAAKQTPSSSSASNSNTNPNCAISTRTRPPKTSSTTTISSPSRSHSSKADAITTSPPSPTNTLTRSPTPTPHLEPSESKSAPSTLAYRAKPTRSRITRSNSMFGAELPTPQAPVVLPTSPSKAKVGLSGGEAAGGGGGEREATEKWNPLPGVRPPPVKLEEGDGEGRFGLALKKAGKEKTLRRVKTMAFPQRGLVLGGAAAEGLAVAPAGGAGAGATARNRRGSATLGRRWCGLVESVEEDVRKSENGASSCLGSAFEMK